MSEKDRDISKAKILIVDDLEMNREILEEMIKDMGGEPLLAESGEEALEVIGRQCPELILTDISMPGMNGYELCKILKRKKETRNVPVIFISAYDEPQDIVEGLTLGGEDYITKPFIPEVVKARVGVLLRGKTRTVRDEQTAPDFSERAAETDGTGKEKYPVCHGQYCGTEF